MTPKPDSAITLSFRKKPELHLCVGYLVTRHPKNKAAVVVTQEEMGECTLEDLTDLVMYKTILAVNALIKKHAQSTARQARKGV